MSEPRSVIAYQHQVEASRKFDYFITGLTGALCAYIVQSWKPHRVTSFGPDVLEAIALVVLFLAAIAGFKRIEWTVVTMQINVSWLNASEKRGAMAGAIQQSSRGLMFNAESGDILSPIDATHHYEALTEVTPEIRK